MSKALYRCITGVVGGMAAIATAVIAYAQPPHAVQLCAAVPIVTTAIGEVLTLFVDPAK